MQTYQRPNRPDRKRTQKKCVASIETSASIYVCIIAGIILYLFYEDQDPENVQQSVRYSYSVVTKREKNALLRTTYVRTLSSSRTIKNKTKKPSRHEGRQASRQAGTQAKAGAPSARAREREREEKRDKEKSCLHHPSHNMLNARKKHKTQSTHCSYGHSTNHP